MKKAFLMVTLAAFVLLGVTPALFVNAEAASISEYAVTEFKSLPGDWELSSLCDTQNVTTSYDADCMQIKSTSTVNQSKYYGALYEIAKNQSYGDFTFEMKFRMESPADNNRWLGIMYHTQKAQSGNLIGYLMNFRYSGGSAASVVTPALQFKDEAQIPSGVPLNDGMFHTLTIAMQNATAWHYIDGKQITQFDTTVKNADLGGEPLTEGGFALIVNRSTVTVRSVKISPTVKKPVAVEHDNELAGTYRHESKLIGAPTVVADVTDKDALASLDGEIRPQSAILRFNANAHIEDENGKDLGAFSAVYQKLAHRVIPILQLKDEACANAFIDYTETTKYILDIAVMSDQAEIVKKVRTALPHVRGIVEYKEISNLCDVVKSSTEAGAMTVILPQELSSHETVEYLQARFKSVWVRETGESDGDAYHCIMSGAYGIVTKSFEFMYQVFDGYEGGYTRNIFNVAHRGLQQVYNENSLGAIRGAMENGATHLELDAHLTKDKHIVLNHDDRIDRETNGSGAINDLTLAEIKQYDLTLKTPYEKIPTLEEALDLIGEVNATLKTKVVLVLEIKDDSADFVENLKRILDEKNFYENLVFIVFESSEHQLAALNAQLPHVPTANLDNVSDTSFASMLPALNNYNTGIDNYLSYYNADFERTLQERGFSGWYWTYSAEADVAKASKEGIIGCTNNVADCAKNYIRYVTRADAADCKEEDIPAVGSDIELDRVSYDGSVKTVTGTVYYTEKTKNGWRIFCSYTETTDDYERTVYTQAINYFAPAKNTKLGIILGITIPCGVIVIASAVAVPLIMKKKKGTSL